MNIENRLLNLKDNNGDTLSIKELLNSQREINIHVNVHNIVSQFNTRAQDMRKI